MQTSDPIPDSAAESIIRDFDRYPLVAIGEGHRNQEVHDFVLALVSDPRFAGKVQGGFNASELEQLRKKFLTNAVGRVHSSVGSSRLLKK